MSLQDAYQVRRAAPGRVAIVIASPAISGTSGWPAGFWWACSAPTAADAGRTRSAARTIRALGE